MSWTYNDWTQDDSVNFGFPYASSSVPAQADFSEVKSVMKLKQNQNFGFPFINEVSSIDYDNVRTAWKIDPDVNFGFPFVIKFKLEKKSRGMPVFSSFSVSGTGAGFHHRTDTIPLDIDKKSDFNFKMPETLYFCFPEKKDVIL